MNKTNWIILIVILLFLAFYPLIFGAYYTNVVVLLGIFSLYALTVNLLLGYTGLLSFGHAMFFGTGGYGTALALEHIEGLAILPAIGIGILASLVLALILCPLLVRASGTAFSMLTMAFGQLMFVLCLKLRKITGGEDGVAGFDIPPLRIPGLFEIDMTMPVNYYYFALVIILISVWLLWFFTKTPFGTIMIGIRDNANRVDYTGFKVPESKAVVFLVSGGFAGLAGALYALFQDMVSADGVFHIFQSFQPVMMAVLGGVGNFFGPIVGAVIFAVLEELTSRYTERVELVTGLVLVLTILFAPMGLTGLMKIAKEKWFGGVPAVPRREES